MPIWKINFCFCGFQYYPDGDISTSLTILKNTSYSRQELDVFIASVNSFHPALKYTWVVSECSIAFLDISVSNSGNRLSTSVHYKPTDSQLFTTLIIPPSTRQELHPLLGCLENADLENAYLSQTQDPFYKQFRDSEN